MKKLLNVPIEVLKLPPNVGRQVFEGIDELAKSIREYGLLQPILVKKDGSKYDVIVGTRRYKASKMAGVKFVQALELDGADEETLLELQLTENIQRKNFLPFEIMRLLAQLRKKGLKVEDLVKKTGLSMSTVSTYLRIQRNLPEYLESIVDGQRTADSTRDLTLQKAALLARADLSHEELDHFVNTIEEEGLTVVQLKKRLCTESKSRIRIKRMVQSRVFWKELTSTIKHYAGYWKEYCKLEQKETVDSYRMVLTIEMPKDLAQQEAPKK